LDEVEDDHGARQADYVLAIVRGVMNFYASRADDYVAPIVQGMRRTNSKERACARISAMTSFARSGRRRGRRPVRGVRSPVAHDQPTSRQSRLDALGGR